MMTLVVIDLLQPDWANQCHALTRTEIGPLLTVKYLTSPGDSKLIQRSLTLSSGFTSKSGLRPSVLDSSTPYALSLVPRDSCLLLHSGNELIRCQGVICTPGVRVLCTTQGVTQCCCHSVSKTSERYSVPGRSSCDGHLGSNACHQRPARPA